MNGALPTLLDEASARLPLFDGLPVGGVDRLAAGGLGRGLLTAALRARLRKGGFADMGTLAVASPSALMAVRKVGPVRVVAIRAHVLGELARIVPCARAEHDQDATDRRRLGRLHAVPAGPIPLGAAPAERLGRGGTTWADLALMRRAEAAGALGASVADLDGIVAVLVLALQPDSAPILSITETGEEAAAGEAGTVRARAEMLQERDREWDEAAPAGRAHPDRSA